MYLYFIVFSSFHSVPSICLIDALEGEKQQAFGPGTRREGFNCGSHSVYEAAASE
jgi:hypothetical protein